MTELLRAYENVAWLLLSACQAVLLLRLWRFGLASRYKWFFIYLAVQVIQVAALYPINRDSEAYAYAYMAAVLAQTVAALFVVLELYGMIARDYSGIGSLGRWVIGAGWGIAALISVLTVAPDLAGSTGVYPKLLAFAAYQRAVNSALLLFLLTISAFLAWFPVPLTRNAVMHAVLFAVTFSSTALLLLLRNLLGYEGNSPVFHLLSAAEITVHLLCLITWIAVLTPAGEMKPMALGSRWQPERAERLAGQLEAINSSLLRTARNIPRA